MSIILKNIDEDHEAPCSFYQQLVSIGVNLLETAFLNIAFYRVFSDGYTLQITKQSWSKTKHDIKFFLDGAKKKAGFMPCALIRIHPVKAAS